MSSSTITIMPSPQQLTLIDHLLYMGLFGATRQEAVERLLSERLRQLIVEDAELRKMFP